MAYGRAVRTVQHDDFEYVRGPVRAEQQIADGIVADLVDGECVSDRVLDVLRIDAMPERRRQNLHPKIRTTKLLSASPLPRLTRSAVGSAEFRSAR